VGIGPQEGLIVLVIGLVLFAPTLIAFWLGYTIGTKRSNERPQATGAPDAAPEQPIAPEEPEE